MNYERIHCERGDSIDLQSNLADTEVAAVSPSRLAVCHDEDASQATYERRRADESGSTIPDTAVIVELGDSVDYLVEV